MKPRWIVVDEEREGGRDHLRAFGIAVSGGYVVVLRENANEPDGWRPTSWITWRVLQRINELMANGELMGVQK